MLAMYRSIVAAVVLFTCTAHATTCPDWPASRATDEIAALDQRIREWIGPTTSMDGP